MSPLGTTQQSLFLAAGLGRLQSLNDAASARVSSGKRIDTPAADVAGVGMAAKLDGQQARLRGVEINLQNGVSRMQSTAGQLNTISRVVTRLSELSVLGSNATQDAKSRSLYQVEFTKLQDQLRQTIGGTTAEIGGTADVSNPSGTYNGTRLFGAAAAETLSVGLQADEQITLPSMNLSNGAMGALISQDASGNYTTTIASLGAGTTINDALTQTGQVLANVGAVQSRIDFSVNIAATASANHEAALSVIRDADLATDVTAISRLNMLRDAHNAMLAQSRDSGAKLIGLLSRN
ncbi:MAG: flagellin [Opitutus sp.]|nr:flagellin [Opitutus sp.]MCS6247747.1 flagellin [Opitutus sp.]MCS6274259.1 flagellin [Opitutus sp.]MCS6277423.1 flagellin [Opitutus sp.]MCS6300540.1 flagellin [Opitutus sp.]